MQLRASTTGLRFAFAAAAISGVSVWVNAFAVRAFGDPTLYTTVKNAIAALLLLLLATALVSRGSGAGFIRPTRLRQVIGLLAVGVVGGGVAFVLFFEGLARTTPSSAAFVQKTLVLWVAILAIALLRERFGKWHVAAIALLMAGQLALSGGFALPALGSGEGMILAATLLWSVEVIIAKSLLRDLSALTVASARMGIGATLLVGFSLASGRLATLGSLAPAQWAWVLLTGLILTAYVAIWLAALKRARAIDVTAVLVFGAIITAALNSGGAMPVLTAGSVGATLIAAGSIGFALLAMRSKINDRQVDRAA